MLTINQSIPTFNFQTTEGMKTFKDFEGRWLVLYFYPKDNTPGCSIEARDFRNMKTQFDKKNAIILGVSRDSLQSHARFQMKESLPFLLVSDESSELCNFFDVIKPKSMYGKQFIGIERSTFLIDPNGVLQKEWRKVKVTGHVEAVLEALISFQD